MIYLIYVLIFSVRSFSRFADDQIREWVKKLDAHMEKSKEPLPIIQADMDLDEKAEAFHFEKRPNFKAFYLSFINCI